ncbi:MAG: hypothetical protein WD824_05745 [Cyclobacteriaceae bacterium]
MEKNENHVQVVVVTTSGSWPKEGFEKIAAHQKVKLFLDKAIRKLNIVTTQQWAVKVGGKVIDPEKTYIEQGLFGDVLIDYGPIEGGGGSRL